MRRTLHRLAGLFAGAFAAATLHIGASAEPAQPPVPIDVDPLAGAAVAADDPRAVDAAWAVLAQGGSAADAAIAAAFTMSVVMPEAASLAGAGAALHYDGEARHVTALVGREVAGRAAEAEWIDAENGRVKKPLDGGQAVGAPTLLQMLGELHRIGGRLPWSAMTAEAERLARAGVPLSAAAARALQDLYLPQNGGADTIYGVAGKSTAAAGTLIRNPQAADVLLAIGRDGPNVLSGGVVGHAIARRVSETRRRPTELALDEIAQARPLIVAPVCVALTRAAFCAPPAPTLGPTTLETAALFEAVAPKEPTARDWAHVMALAHRLAIADARRYLGDPAVFPDLTTDLLTPHEIARRAKRIRLDADRGRPAAARLRYAPRGLVSSAANARRLPTASVVVTDKDGDAVALSVTLTRPFGAGLTARGVLLNAANVAFDPPPDRPGLHAANAIRPGARPRLDLAPVMALDADRRLVLAAAGAGGENLPAYLAKTALAALNFNKSASAAVAAPNVASRDRTTELEIRTPAERLDGALSDIGHKPVIKALPSGLVLLLRRGAEFEAAADARGQGEARARPRETPGLLDLGKRGS